MKVNAIIGAGELGSRHLQGLLKLAMPQHIVVLDPSAASLDTARHRAAEIPSTAQLSFITEWSELPATLDLVIVATGAGVRAAVTSRLLQQCTMQYLVLEKVLFQDLASYVHIGKLLQETATPTWVNHPRRMFTHYQQIKQVIREKGNTVSFTAVGGNWGLACNCLHLIDTCAYLCEAAVAELDMNWVDEKIHESKRPGFIEFTGTVKGRMTDGSSFSITSFDGAPAGLSVFIATTTDRWTIHEGASNKIHHSRMGAGAIENSYTVPMRYQSSLTTDLADDLFSKATCELPSFNEACAAHIPFIDAAIKKYALLSGKAVDYCPIT